MDHTDIIICASVDVYPTPYCVYISLACVVCRVQFNLCGYSPIYVILDAGRRGMRNTRSRFQIEVLAATAHLADALRVGIEKRAETTAPLIRTGHNQLRRHGWWLFGHSASRGRGVVATALSRVSTARAGGSIVYGGRLQGRLDLLHTRTAAVWQLRWRRCLHHTRLTRLTFLLQCA